MRETDVEALIDAATPLVLRLPQQERRRLSYLVDLFLENAEFEGADFFNVTPRIAVTIATHACFLLLRRRVDRFGGRLHIVIHGGGIVDKPDTMGTYSRTGRIDLNWDDVLRGGFIDNDGCNVVMHEFAHRLDGPLFLDGMPSLHSLNCHLTWKRVISEEYEAFCADVEQGEPTPLNPYAATHIAEFFACATEALFEQPDMLRSNYPRLFERLVHFYGDGIA